MLQSLGTWHFNPEDRLGGGGLAQTYRCTHPDRPGHFAIKVLNDPTHLNTLLREVNALVRLGAYPGIPSLLDYGRNADGRLCMVCSLMPGVRLDHWVRKTGPLGLRTTLRVVTQLLGMLEHTHRLGVLHKDIKHSNILIDGDQVSLLDWGASERADEPPGETLRAKLSFVAPESYYGIHGPASDLYALAWLMIFIATGLQPYHCGEHKDKHYWALAHLFERRELPELPPPLQALVGHWLPRDPARRTVHYALDDLLQRGDPGNRLDGEAPDTALLPYEALRQHDPLRLGSERGVPYFQCLQADQLSEAGDRTGARALWAAAAAQGYPRACRKLAVQLLAGPDGHDEALRLLATAARRGSPASGYLLAKVRQQQGEACGPGTEPWTLLTAASSAGHASALVLLARQLPEWSRRLALEWAAESGHPRAIRTLEQIPRS